MRSETPDLQPSLFTRGPRSVLLPAGVASTAVLIGLSLLWIWDANLGQRTSALLGISLAWAAGLTGMMARSPNGGAGFRTLATACLWAGGMELAVVALWDPVSGSPAARLWLAARLVEGAGLAGFGLLAGHRVRPGRAAGAMVGLAVLVTVLAVIGQRVTAAVVPDRVGLVATVLLLTGAAAVFRRRRREVGPAAGDPLTAAVAVYLVGVAALAGLGEEIGMAVARLARPAGAVFIWSALAIGLRPEMISRAAGSGDGVVSVQAVLDAIPDHAALVDARGTIRAVNRAWQRFAEENGGGDPVAWGVEANYFAVCRRSRDAGEPAAGRALAGLKAVGSGRRETFTMEYACHSESARRWFTMRARPLGAGTGWLQVLHTDVTSREIAERALRESEAELRRIFEAANVGIARVAPDGRFLQVNAKFCGILGYSEAELTVMSFQELTHPDDLHLDQAQVDRVLAGEIDTFELEKRFIRKSGEPVWIVLYSSVLRARDGTVRYAIAVVQDISGRKASEAALAESRAELAAVFDNAPQMLILLDPEWRIRKVNEAVDRFIGDTDKTVIGRSIGQALGCVSAPMDSRLCGGSPDCLSCALHRAVTDAFGTGEPRRQVETLVTHKVHGRTESLTMLASVARLTTNRGPRVLVCLEDITEKKRLETRYAQAQRLESVGQLAGGVAHDFNNMLSVILGYAGMLKGDLGEASVHREMVSEIQKAAERSRNLTRQLLAFSRKQTLELRPVDLCRIVGEMEKMLRRTVREDIAFNWHPGDAPCRTLADVGRIEQVLMNLVVNAADAMPDGGSLTVETAAVRLDAAYAEARPGVVPGPYVMLAVSDTGQGIDPEIRERIFDPFFTTKGKHQGTGLGLATVYGIVKQHGGNVWVYSEPGRGTTFKVYLPHADGEARSAEKQPDGPPPADQSATVLVVEDDRSVRQLVRSMLDRHGYTVIEAETASAAIDKARRHGSPIHLLLTDVVMPEMKGPEVHERVRQWHPEIRVLYTSGYTENVISRQGVLMEGVRFIQKPFSRVDLLRKVAEAIRDAH